MNAGRRVTFRELFEQHPAVCVPIVQRDYAQGRASEEEVRTEFLNALHSALTKAADDPTLPLDLDFVYGSVDGAAGFMPLDGQQRLTTLLLLHWYLAVRDGHLPEFALADGPGRRSRFTYAVRPSSMEFFDMLVHWQPPQWSVGVPLSRLIADQPWFFLSWTMDPTIQSALTMLDAIDVRFAEDTGLYQRLVDSERPAITFQLLDLNGFGLSDDLYIKMNSRGKPLTAFETFKAQLEHLVATVLPDSRFDLHGREVRVREYLSHRIDTEWSDVLWHYRDPVTKVFDDRFMNLVRVVVAVTRNPASAGYEELIRALRNTGETFTFFRYHEAGCLDAPFLETLIALLDAWAGAHDGIRELLPLDSAFPERPFASRAMFDATRLSYSDLVQFSGYCRFLTSYGAQQASAFGEWMRVIVNLSSNTTYDRVDDFVRSMNSVRDLLPHALAVLPYVAQPGTEIRGFNGQQVNEERAKAALFLVSPAWRDAIRPAEAHGYFAGQIEFLLAFSGVLEDWKADSGFGQPGAPREGRLAAFIDYRKKAFAVFDENGVRPFPDFLWERALLSHGDYLLWSGRNVSLLHNAASERDVSWKRLLRGGPSWDAACSKREIVRHVLDRVDPSQAAASLATIVAAARVDDPWRDLLVRNPEALAYCRQRNIRRDGSRTYLLSKHRMSGEHVELETYALFLRLRPLIVDPARNIEVGYLAVSGDDKLPFMWAVFPGETGCVRTRVFPMASSFNVVVRRDYEPDALLPQGFVEEMGVVGFAVRDEELVLETSIETAEQLMREFPARARAWRFAG